MILNYYQAVELMSSLPVLLSHADNKKVQETVYTPIDDNRDKNPDKAAIVEMWGFTSQLLEVNGADFY